MQKLHSMLQHFLNFPVNNKTILDVVTVSRPSIILRYYRGIRISRFGFIVKVTVFGVAIVSEVF